MASLSEMLQYADYMAKNKQENSIPGRLSSLVQAGMGGYEYGQQLKTRRLDQQIKTIDLQKKQQELEDQAMNTRITKNIAKAMNILPLDDSESGNARNVALDSATVIKPPADNTGTGRIRAIHTGDGDYNVVPGSLSKHGLNFDFRKSDSSKPKEKDQTSKLKDIRQMAEEMARKEKYNTIASTLGPEEAQKYSNVQGTEDEVQKYMPEATAYYNGDQPAAEKIRSNRRNQGKIVQDSINTLQTQIQDERARLGVNAAGGNDTSIYSMFHIGDAANLDKLVKRRDELIQGGNMDTIRNHIKEDLDVLKQDPKGNRAQIVELTKKLLQLAETGRKR